mmetsp:Transcript_19799/g.41184  ORF Transcript_19799/g.41184 Transcript_19799/m.41184 type:complete len:147 (+) Transcript_19799:168-608(+)
MTSSATDSSASTLQLVYLESESPGAVRWSSWLEGAYLPSFQGNAFKFGKLAEWLSPWAGRGRSRCEGASRGRRKPIRASMWNCVSCGLCVLHVMAKKSWTAGSFNELMWLKALVLRITGSNGFAFRLWSRGKAAVEACGREASAGP